MRYAVQSLRKLRTLESPCERRCALTQTLCESFGYYQKNSIQGPVVTECVEFLVLPTLVVHFCQNEFIRPCRLLVTAVRISKGFGKTRPSLLGPRASR